MKKQLKQEAKPQFNKELITYTMKTNWTLDIHNNGLETNVLTRTFTLLNHTN